MYNIKAETFHETPLFWPFTNTKSLAQLVKVVLLPLQAVLTLQEFCVSVLTQVPTTKLN